MSKIKDSKLKEAGAKQVEWAEEQMGGLLTLCDSLHEEQPFKGMMVGMALHVTKETAVLVKTLVDLGAEVVIYGPGFVVVVIKHRYLCHHGVLDDSTVYVANRCPIRFPSVDLENLDGGLVEVSLDIGDE